MMQDNTEMKPFNLKRTHLWFYWISVSTAIVLLSVYGRPLQYLVADSIGYTVAAWIIGLTLLMTISLFLYALKKYEVKLSWFHIVLLCILFLVLPLFLERVEERLHFLTFGLFGVVSLLLFSPRFAFTVCILGAAGDELLQLYLPDRVGDLRDVAMNCVASMGAAYVVYSTRVKASDQK